MLCFMQPTAARFSGGPMGRGGLGMGLLDFFRRAAKADVPPVIRHIEAHLGLIDPQVGLWGWDHRDTGTRLDVHGFRDSPLAGATTLCSTGLSCHELCSPRGHVRQELLLACWDRFVSRRLAGLLAIAASQALQERAALLHGQVLGPSGPLIPGSELQALLCLEPFLFPKTLTVCRDTRPPTDFIWLVPISEPEALEVASAGVSQLIDRWEAEGVQLLDWARTRMAR
jgi:hypothetical protein